MICMHTAYHIYIKLYRDVGLRRDVLKNIGVG